MVPFSRVEGSILVLEDNYVHLNVAMVANAMCFISGLEKYDSGDVSRQSVKSV